MGTHHDVYLFIILTHRGKEKRTRKTDTTGRISACAVIVRTSAQLTIRDLTALCRMLRRTHQFQDVDFLLLEDETHHNRSDLRTGGTFLRGKRGHAIGCHTVDEALLCCPGHRRDGIAADVAAVREIGKRSVCTDSTAPIFVLPGRYGKICIIRYKLSPQIF